MDSDTPTTTTAPSATTASKRSGSNNEAIDIQKALDILSLRSSGHDHDHDHEQHDCHNHVPAGGQKMGQEIDLMAAAEIEQDLEKRKQELAEERTKREVEIRTKLQTMTVKELLAAVLDAQTGRVATYREYNEGLETVLETRNVSSYPAMCAKATASFSFLSDTINTIQSVLNDKHERQLTHIASLQQHEREKLQITAALHLEQMRQEESGSDKRATRLLTQGVIDLKKRLAACVETINEDLEEIRYAMMEEEE